MSERTSPAQRQRDARWRAMVLVVGLVVAGGLLIAALSEGGAWSRRSSGASVMTDEFVRSADTTRKEIHLRFQQGVAMLHAKQYEHAMTAFHRVLQLDPAMPEAHVDMGFALVGLQRYGVARDFFMSAIELRGEQANAYYGLAVALDALKDRAGAIGAMRTFVHLSPPDDPSAKKAHAALREWQAQSRPTNAGSSMARQSGRAE